MWPVCMLLRNVGGEKLLAVVNSIFICRGDGNVKGMSNWVPSNLSWVHIGLKENVKFF